MTRQPPPLRLRLAYGSCIILMLVSLAVIAWKLPHLRQAGAAETRQPMTPEQVGALFSRSLLVSESQFMRLADSQSKYLILFLFTPADCAACLPELADLSRFDQERPDVEVLALMSFSSPDEARQTRENFSLEIPVLQDPSGELLEAFAPPQTPWKVVVRRADRRVLFESPRSVSAEERDAFLARVRRLGTEPGGADGGTGG
ncbi:MAG: AhpC/TSA family [Acidobacteriota bacterium]|nr:AhpC/TSA family [Acidobacteriota bacterium]